MTWSLVEEEEPQLAPPQTRQSGFRDVVSEELRSQGVTPDEGEEMERLIEHGSSEATKGLLSGASLGLTKNVPTLKPGENIAATTGEFIGSTLPISRLLKIFNAPLVSLASKSPIFQKQLTSLANLTGAFLAGGAYQAGETVAKGEMPNPNEMIEHGAQWGLLDAALQTTGKAGQFVSSLVKKSRASKTAPFKVLNETLEQLNASKEKLTTPEKIAENALDILVKEPVQVQVDIRGKKIEPQFLDKLSKEAPSIAEPYQPSELKLPEVENSLIKSQNEARLNAISERAGSEKELGENIQKDIQDQLKKAQEGYEPLYELVQEQAKDIKYEPTKTMDLVDTTLKDLQSLKTKPEGYQKVISTLEDALEDLGNKKLNTRGFGGFTVKEPIPLTNLMELGRRLNKIIDYDIVGSSIKDKLKPVVRSVKQEIREALGKANPTLSQVFNTAEKSYGDTAEKFGKELILKMRGEQIPEKLAKYLDHPTSIQELKKVLSPKQISQVEREVLNKIEGLSPEKSRKYYREVQDQLSPESRKVALEIVKEKSPQSPFGKDAQIRKLQNGVLDDLSQSLASGKRPEKTLKLMKTNKGTQIVNDAIKGTPNKKEVLNYLREQSFYDFASSIVGKDGKIDYKKLNEYLKDTATINNLKQLGGSEAVNFLRNLENMTKRFEKNLKLMEKIPGKQAPAEYGKDRLKQMARKEQPFKFKVEDLVDSLGIPTKTALGVIGALTFGIPKTAVAGVGLKLLYKMIINPKVQRAFKNALNQSRISPVQLLQSFEKFDKLVGEEELENTEGQWILQEAS
jgi:hemoglobin-like flavoprotein